MSGSEKYQQMLLAEREERRLREERGRKQREEAARRLAEEERRVRQRLEKSREALQAKINHAHKRIADTLATEAGREGKDELKAIEPRLHQHHAATARAANEVELGRIGVELRRDEGALAKAVALGESRRIAKLVAREEAEIVALDASFGELNEGHSKRFDADGRRETEGLIDKSRVALAAKDLDRTRGLLSSARAQLARHQANVAERFECWEASRRKAVAAVSAAADRVAGLRADEICIYWATQTIEALERDVARSLGEVEGEQFDVAVAAAKAIMFKVDEMLPEIQELQLQREIQGYIVGGVVTVLDGMGFVVKDVIPDPSCPSHPQAARIIQAVRVGGGGLSISVPQGDQIEYTVNGFPVRKIAGSDGKPARTCHEAEEEIQKLSDKLLQDFRVRTSEIHWEGKDPKIAKRADELPHETNALKEFGA